MAQAGGYLTYGKHPFCVNQLVPSPVWVWNHPVPEGELRRLPPHLWWDNVKMRFGSRSPGFRGTLYHYLSLSTFYDHG